MEPMTAVLVNAHLPDMLCTAITAMMHTSPAPRVQYVVYLLAIPSAVLG